MSIAVAPEEEQPVWCKGAAPVAGQPNRAIKYFNVVEKRVAEALASRGIFAYLPSLAFSEVEGATILTARFTGEAVPLDAPDTRIIGVLRDNYRAERQMKESQR